MSKYLYIPAFAVLLCALVYLLYRRGLVTSKCIKAVLFLFQPGRSADRATVDACTGWVSHAGRFRGGQTYVFTLDMRLSRGEAAVLLLDSGKRELLRLDCHTPTAAVTLDGQSRYFLRWNFRDATGRCELRWQPYSEA